MRVLLATDGSADAGLGVDLVAGLEWPAGTAIRVVEAIETGSGLFGGPWPAIALVQADELEAELRVEARRTVDDARERLARPGLEVVSAVLEGRPATAVVEAAREMNADLVVVGSRGHGTIERMVLGSVSAEVIDHAPAPVLVARGTRVDRVVLAWDGSGCADLAADTLRRWPIFAASAVRVVSVTDVEVPWWTGFPEPDSPGLIPGYLEAVDASRREHDEQVRKMAAELRAVGLAAEGERREGDAATEILAAARAFDADLIVAGTHGRTGLPRIVLGSVARNVLEHAPCSVLVVREGPGSRTPTGERHEAPARPPS